MQLTRLSAALGARVEDVEFGRDDGAFRAALREHHLLLMRGRPVSDDEHLALTGLLGRVASERCGPIGLVSNVRPGGALGSEPASWHADYMFFPAPYEYISLYALELPSGGTQTSFVNGVLAARTLPPELRRRVEGLYGRAVADLAKSRSMSDGGTEEPRSLRRVCVGEDQDLTIFLNPTSVAR